MTRQSARGGRRAAREASRLEALFDPGVRTVDLMLTTGCNLRCAYCYQARNAPRTMSAAILDAAIRQLVSSRLDRPRLTLYGGEPLLVPTLVRRALDRVRQWAPRRMKPDIRIVTNGTRLDEEMARLLVSCDVHVTLSFDGVAPAQDVREAGTFGRLDGLLRRLRRDHPKHLRTRFAVKTTLTAQNVPHLAESFRYLLARGVRDVEIVPVLPDDPGWSRRSARELDRQLGAIACLSSEEHQRSGEIPFQPFRSTAEPDGKDGGSCACGSRGLLFVDVDGTLAPCAVLAPSTFNSPPKAVRRVMKALGGFHVTDLDLPAALLRREARARRSVLLTGPGKGQETRGAGRGIPRPGFFVCPVALAQTGGRVAAIQTDFHRLAGKHRAGFQREIRSSASRRGRHSMAAVTRP